MHNPARSSVCFRGVNCSHFESEILIMENNMYLNMACISMFNLFAK